MDEDGDLMPTIEGEPFTPAPGGVLSTQPTAVDAAERLGWKEADETVHENEVPCPAWIRLPSGPLNP